MVMKPKKWLITGGCGFIGTSLIAELVAEGGHYIRVVDNLSVGTPADLGKVAQFSERSLEELDAGGKPSCVDLVHGDIMDAELALEVVKGMDVIVHLAANTGVGPSVENPRMDCEANVFGTFNYLEAARQAGVSRFVFASSGAPAGEVEPPIHEEMPPHPVSPYGASKLAGEGYCSAYARTYGLTTVMLRFGNVYGPLSGHKNSVVAKFIKRVLDGKDLDIYGDGTQTRDFIYISDLVKAVRLAASVDDIAGEAFQIATSRETSVGELADTLGKACVSAGLQKPKVVFSQPRLGDVKRNYSDTSKAASRLDWKPEIQLEEGLKITLDWFLEV